MKYAVLLAFLGIFGCKGPERISRFAGTAAAGLGDIAPPALTFTGYCRLYSKKGLESLVDTGVYVHGKKATIGCRDFEKADSLLRVTSEVLITYLHSLESLADKKLVVVKSKELVASLSSLRTGMDASKTLTETQVSAAARILNALINVPLTAYRQNRLLGFIRRSQPDFDSVAAGYAFMIGEVLPSLLDQSTENYRSFIYAPEYRMAQSGIEKIFVNREYAEFLDARDRDRDVLKKSARLISTVREGHHRMAVAPDLDAGDIEASLVQYTLLVLQLRADIQSVLQH